MVLFNYSTKELTAKIVYYGPGLCGKTTNLQFFFDSLPDEKKGRMLSLSTQTDRTLYFDFLPVELGNIRGMKTRMQLYTVPGQVFYNETRKMVLKGVDGVVFVADSQRQMAGANLESFKNLEENLREHGSDLSTMPLVLQYNKRDLPSIQPVEEMNAALNRYNAPFYEAIATTGIGVHDTLKAISKLVLLALSGDKDPLKGAAGKGRSPVQAPAAPPPAAVPPSPPVAMESDTQAWDTEGLDEMLEQMDADEIQGLLEEVDEFGGSAPATAAADLAATEPDPVWAGAGDDPEPTTPDPGPADETSFAELAPEPEEHAIWLGDEEQDDGQGGLPDVVPEPEPAGAQEEALAAAFEAHADDLQPGPLDEDEDLFATPPARDESTESTSGQDEENLTFESFLAEERGHKSPAAAVPEAEGGAGEWATDPEAEHRDEAWPMDPTEELPDEDPAAGDDAALLLDHATLAPRLSPGTPVANGDGTIKVPLRVQVGSRTYAYTLTVSVDAHGEAEPDALV